MKIFLLLVITMLIFFSCKQDNSDFERGLYMLKNQFDEKELNQFKSKPEEIALRNIKFNKNLFFEENYLRKVDGKNLVLIFKSNGIYNYEDMTDIMLVCLYRKLNSNNYDFKGLINSKLNKFKSTYDCELKRRIQAQVQYYKFENGDTITIRYPFDEIDQTTYYLDCPNIEWKFDKKKDIDLTGIIYKKSISEDSMSYFFDIKVYKMSKVNTRILSINTNPGDSIKTCLNYIEFVRYSNPNE